jgi:protein TonB
MSHALPAPLLDIDAKRIAATAFAIAVHAIAFMLLLAPMEWTPPVARVETTVVPDWDPVKPLPPPPPPPPSDDPVRPRDMTRAPVAPLPVPDEPPVVSDEPNPMATEYVPVDEPPVIATFNPPPTGPLALQVLQSPAPIYPASAIRQGVTGKVVLLIEVDATGRAVSGIIEQSSGSKLLDQAALKVVLAKWRFVPAQHAGQPITATARVPIIFSLD